MGPADEICPNCGSYYFYEETDPQNISSQKQREKSANIKLQEKPPNKPDTTLNKVFVYFAFIVVIFLCAIIVYALLTDKSNELQNSSLISSDRYSSEYCNSADPIYDYQYYNPLLDDDTSR